jgi:hypothetical protein
LITGKHTRLFGLIGAALLMLTLAAPVMARDGDVIRQGDCSGNSTWKLKAGLRDGRIEVEFQVDQNRVGRVWRVWLRDNGTLFMTGLKTTVAPSGSFTVERTTRNHVGTDRIVARAVNVTSGEVCRGVVSI